MAVSILLISSRIPAAILLNLAMALEIVTCPCTSLRRQNLCILFANCVTKYVGLKIHIQLMTMNICCTSFCAFQDISSMKFICMINSTELIYTNLKENDTLLRIILLSVFSLSRSQHDLHFRGRQQRLILSIVCFVYIFSLRQHTMRYNNYEIYCTI